MDHAIDPEADLLILMSADAEVNKYLAKINEKLKQLKTIGLTKNDQIILEKRLRFVWSEPGEASPPADDPGKLKAWRHTRARLKYTEIQNADNYVFISVILVISPSEIVKPGFHNVVNYLLDLNNRKPFRLNLTSTKKFFESTSAEQGFTGSRQYLRFMEVVFPQGENRVIQYAYSLVPLDDIPAFLQTMLDGIYKSRLYRSEMGQGTKASSCLSVLVPPNEQDGGCTLVVDRKTLINAIYKFGLSELKIE